jgi:hypothetical protein
LEHVLSLEEIETKGKIPCKVIRRKTPGDISAARFKGFLYATHLTPEEEEIFEELETAELTHEVKLLRIRIFRLLEEEKIANAAAHTDAIINIKDPETCQKYAKGLILDDYTESYSAKDGIGRSFTKKRKQFDYLLMSYIGRLAAVQKTISEINSTGGGGTDERAAEILDALELMEELEASEYEPEEGAEDGEEKTQ